MCQFHFPRPFGINWCVTYLEAVVQTPTALSASAIGKLPAGDFQDVARGVPDHGGAGDQHEQQVRHCGQQNGQQRALGNVGRRILQRKKSDF